MTRRTRRTVRALGTLLAATAAATAAAPAGASTGWDGPGWGWEMHDNGVRYTTPFSSHDVLEPISTAHRAEGGGTGRLGYPTSERVLQGSRHSYQTFERGIVYASGAGVFPVHTGPLTALHERSDGGTGSLGYPTGRQVNEGGPFWFQAFERGHAYVSAAAPGGAAVTGTMDTAHRQLGGGRGTLGYPVAEESGTTDPAFRHQEFERGWLHLTPTGAFTVTGPVLATYAAANGSQGGLGLAAGSQTDQRGGYVFQEFSGGVVYTSPRGSHVVAGAVNGVHRQRGGGTGVLGYPVGAETSRDSRFWAVQQFERGAIYRTGSSAYAVVGGFLAPYAAAGGPYGPLGFPTTDEIRLDGATWMQSFERGIIRVEHGRATVVPIR